MATPTIRIEDLQELLTYDPVAGSLSWKSRPRKFFKRDRDCKAWNSRFAGRAAFTARDNDGYPIGSLFDRLYRAHVVAFAMATGRWPSLLVDHRNGDRTDFRFENLRESSHSDNAKNMAKTRRNKSGVKGVHWNSSVGKWQALLSIDKKQTHLGYFDDLALAASAISSARILNHGQFARHA